LKAPDAHPRFAHVDSLRAVAALLVVWTHGAEVFAPAAGGSRLWDIARTCDFGRIGVVAFFGVSGFLVPKSIDAGRPDAGRVFLIRRAFRLFPAFWLSIPLGLASIWWLFGRHIGAADIAANLTMIPDAFGAQPVMGLYWTLEYELAFYALCFALLRAGWLNRRGVMAGGAALFLAAFVLGFAALVALHRQEPGDLGVVALNMGALFMGALWRQQLDGELRPLERRVLIAGLGLFWAGIPLACAYAIVGHGSRNAFFVHFPVSYAAGMGLFIAMTSVAKVRVRPLAWLGLVSYSLYLLHPVAIYALSFAFGHGAPGGHWPVGVQMLGAAAISVVLAAAAFYLVERPAIEIGRRLTSKPA
jgi:peptidoglycan/LPS O-acetylase OafA/YrhL